MLGGSNLCWVRGLQRKSRPARVQAVDTLAALPVSGIGAEAAVATARPSAAGFDAWAAERGPSLLVFATAVTGNREAARDAVQDALVAVYLRWARLIIGGEPDAYARRVIINRHISWWRRLGRRERLTAFDQEPGPAGAGEQDSLADVELARRLLAGLPAQQRAAVALRFYDDLAFADIAAALGCTESTARSHVHRALARLRAQISEDSDD